MQLERISRTTVVLPLILFSQALLLGVRAAVQTPLPRLSARIAHRVPYINSPSLLQHEDVVAPTASAPPNGGPTLDINSAVPRPTAAECLFVELVTYTICRYVNARSRRRPRT